MSDSLRAGADAFLALICRIREQGDRDVQISLDDPGCPDSRDYREMSQLVAASIAANLNAKSAKRREGYLRAMTDLLSIAADGCAPGQNWDPLANTNVAFSAPRLASELLTRARL